MFRLESEESNNDTSKEIYDRRRKVFVNDSSHAGLRTPVDIAVYEDIGNPDRKELIKMMEAIVAAEELDNPAQDVQNVGEAENLEHAARDLSGGPLPLGAHEIEDAVAAREEHRRLQHEGRDVQGRRLVPADTGVVVAEAVLQRVGLDDGRVVEVRDDPADGERDEDDLTRGLRSIDCL